MTLPCRRHSFHPSPSFLLSSSPSNAFLSLLFYVENRINLVNVIDTAIEIVNEIASASETENATETVTGNEIANAQGSPPRSLYVFSLFFFSYHYL